MRAEINALGEEALRQSDAEITHRLAALPGLSGAETVFCYVSVGREIDTRALLETLLSQGKRVCVPRTLGGGVMEARQITALGELKPAPFSLLEPDETAPLVPPGEIAFALVPALCADVTGVRLGQGGGYYDRYLPATPALRVCPCRGVLLRRRLPFAGFDEKCHLVVTEKNVYPIP